MLALHDLRIQSAAHDPYGVWVEPVTFRAKLWRYSGPGGWHFVTLPEKYAPPVTHGWGRTPVDAMVNGHAWKTSVWRDKKRRTLLAVPKTARGDKKHGDIVSVTISFRAL